MRAVSYEDPKYKVEFREYDEGEETLVVLCTHFPKGHVDAYNSRSYEKPGEYERYLHDRLECFKFVIECFRHWDAGAPYKLVIVDNNSIDREALDYVRNLHDISVCCRKNTFYSFGAYRWAYYNLAPPAYYLFMEQDWMPSKDGWLKDLIDHWNSDKEIGMIGNKIESRGYTNPPINDNQRMNNAFIEKINPKRKHHHNLDSEYLFTSRSVLDQMMEHDGWLMFPCSPDTTLPPTFNELAFQQPILEMGYKISCYDDKKHTMFYATHNRDFPPEWDHGFGDMLAPLIPEQTRCFMPQVRKYLDFYNHEKHNSLFTDPGQTMIPTEKMEDVQQRMDSLSPIEQQCVMRDVYYKTNVIHGGRTAWLGVPAQKIVTDAWVYQELITKVRPDLIIETGTAFGGSALFLASLCELLDHGKVITIDIENRIKGDVGHPRLTKIVDSSVSRPTVDGMRLIAKQANHVLVILDSEHTYDHVSKELDAYSPMVTSGSYLIIEDTYLPPVATAVEEFLQKHPEFSVDSECEKYYVTYNPGGYLKRE